MTTPKPKNRNHPEIESAVKKLYREAATPKPKKAKYTFEIFLRQPVSVRGYTMTGNPHWYWRCRHRNGNIIADGAEGYSSKAKLNRSLGRFTWGIKTSEYEIEEV